MQLVTYDAGRGPRAGVSIESRIFDAEQLGFATRAKTILRDGEFEALLAAAERAARAGRAALGAETVALRAPILNPDKILCLGLNYKDHAAEQGARLPAVPIYFAKYRNSLVGPYEDVHVPRAAAAQVDYEVELAAIVGRRAFEVPAERALEYVAGYSCFNDLSARDLQMQNRQWLPGKAIDGFAPMGPGITPASAVRDPQALRLKTLVNGEVVQDASTAEMIFSVAECIAFASTFMTLEPGDVIATGTPAGVGFVRKPPLFLKNGDVVEIAIEGLGSLRNKIVVHE